MKASRSQPVPPPITKGKCMHTIKTDSSKLKSTKVGEMAWGLRAYAVLAEDPIYVPSIHISNSQVPVTPDPGIPMPLASVGTCIQIPHTDTYT